MFAIALEDDLAQELCNFKQQENYDDKIVERILYHYKAPILVSQQYMKAYYSDEATLSPILGANNDIDFERTLEELATTQTLYKIILSKDKSEFPFVNIFKDKLENNFTATFIKNEERLKAKEHFKALFNEAKSLFIYDNFLHCENVQKAFEEFAKECFPKKQLNIFYPASLPFNQNLCTHLRELCQDWQIKQNQDTQINSNYTNLHDRYIIIDKKLQVILTSGIDYLMNISKDFTYIIREIKIE